MSNIMVCDAVPCPQSPSYFYGLWASEIGVSSTETLTNLNGDDVPFKFLLDSDCLYPGSNNAQFCCEGLIGWSGTKKTIGEVFFNFSRMFYYNNIQPDHFIAFRHDGYDCISKNCKIQKGMGKTIIAGTITTRATYNPDRFIDFAIKFNDNLDLPEIVLNVSGAGANIYAYNLFPSASVKIDRQYIETGNYFLRFSTVPAVAPSARDFYIGRGFLDPSRENEFVRSNKALPVSIAKKDIYYSGAYKISGTVKEKATPSDKPVSTRVLLFDQKANVVVREQWSDPITGEYLFDYIAPDHEYKVESFDHTGRFGAVIADKQRAEPM